MFYNYYSTQKYRELLKEKGYTKLENPYFLLGAFKHPKFQDNRLLLNINKIIFPCLYIQKDLSQIDLRQIKSRKYFRVYGSSLQKIKRCDGFKVQLSYTFLIDLSKTEQELFTSFDYSLQKQIKKAKDFGLSVVMARSQSDFLDYYHLLKKFRDSRNFSTESKSFALKMWNVLHENNTNKSCYEVFLCKDKDDNVLSGLGIIMNPEEKNFIEVASARSKKSEKEKMPDNDFLKYSIILWAKGNGMIRYDLAGANPDAKQNSKEYNIYKYKSKWGGTLTKVYNYQFTNNSNPLYRIINKIFHG